MLRFLPKGEEGGEEREDGKLPPDWPQQPSRPPPDPQTPPPFHQPCTLDNNFAE